MDYKALVAISTVAAITASGCTSLESKKLIDEKSTPLGLTYRLPVKQFSVKATFEITGCKARDTDADLEAKVTASISESLIGGEAFTIDYQKLNTWTKVTNSEFQVSEAGLLTGVNASIVDQSGSIIKNSVAATASIARAVVLPEIPAVGGLDVKAAADILDSVNIQPGNTANFSILRDALKQSQGTLNEFMAYSGKKIDKKANEHLTRLKKKVIDPCDLIKKTLVAKKDSESKLKEEKSNDSRRADAQASISEATLQIKTLADLAETYEKLGDSKEKAKLLKRVQFQQKVKEEAEATLRALGDSKTEELMKKLADINSKLSVTGSLDFAPVGDNDTAEMTLSSTDLENLVDGQLDVQTIKLPSVSIVVKPLTVTTAEASKLPKSEAIGIAYRTPVASVAKVYAKDTGGRASNLLLLEKATQVPQFGPVGSINLNNEIFDDNLIELAFNGSTGAPSRLAFRAKSKGEAATASMRDATGTYLQLQRDKRDDRIAANKVLLDQANAQISFEKAKSDLDLARVQARVSTAKTVSDAQQALVSAQIQLLRDQQRLDAVRTGTATAAEVELEDLNTKEQLLAQQLKIMKLEQEIAEQKAVNSISGAH